MWAFQQDFEEVYELDGRLEKSFNVAEGGFLKVKNVTGYIKVNSWSKNEVKVIAFERRHRYDDGIARIWIEKRGNKVYVETEYDKYYKRRRSWFKSFRNSFPGVEYEIVVPEKFSVETSNVTGGVIIKNIKGDVNSETVTGSVEISNVIGNVFAKTTTGRVRLRRIDGEVDAETTTGSVTIYDSSIPNLRARTTTGSIDVETLSVNPDGRYDLQATTGSLSFAIPSDSRASLRIKYRGNNFRTDFDLEKYYYRKERRSGRYFYEDYGRSWKRKTIVDDINGGGARVYMETTNGRIELRKLR